MAVQTLTQLIDSDQLDAAIEESRVRPVLLFKHSRSCGVSAEALDELRSHVEQSSDTPAVYKMITVQSHRQVSDLVSSRLGIRHETPQAIVVRDGRPVWIASHFRITAAAIAKNLGG